MQWRKSIAAHSQDVFIAKKEVHRSPELYPVRGAVVVSTWELYEARPAGNPGQLFPVLERDDVVVPPVKYEDRTRKVGKCCAVVEYIANEESGEKVAPGKGAGGGEGGLENECRKRPLPAERAGGPASQ